MRLVNRLDDVRFVLSRIIDYCFFDVSSVIMLINFVCISIILVILFLVFVEFEVFLKNGEFKKNLIIIVIFL